MAWFNSNKKSSAATSRQAVKSVRFKRSPLLRPQLESLENRCVMYGEHFVGDGPIDISEPMLDDRMDWRATDAVNSLPFGERMWLPPPPHSEHHDFDAPDRGASEFGWQFNEWDFPLRSDVESLFQSALQDGFQASENGYLFNSIRAAIDAGSVAINNGLLAPDLSSSASSNALAQFNLAASPSSLDSDDSSSTRTSDLISSSNRRDTSREQAHSSGDSSADSTRTLQKRKPTSEEVDDELSLGRKRKWQLTSSRKADEQQPSPSSRMLLVAQLLEQTSASRESVERQSAALQELFAAAKTEAQIDQTLANLLASDVDRWLSASVASHNIPAVDPRSTTAAMADLVAATATSTEATLASQLQSEHTQAIDAVLAEVIAESAVHPIAAITKP